MPYSFSNTRAAALMMAGVRSRLRRGRHRTATVNRPRPEPPPPPQSAATFFLGLVGTTLVLRGSLDYRAQRTIESAATRLIRRCCQSGRPVGHIDAGGLTFVDAGGVAALVRLSELLTSAGLRLHTAHPGAQLQRLSDIFGLGAVLGLATEELDWHHPPQLQYWRV